jgi:iron complex transport system substrate-binding protein
MVALAVAAGALMGCSAKPEPASQPAQVGSKSGTGVFPLTITDDASRTVTIEAVPKRIVSLAPANTEILYALGAFDRVVGVTTFDDYPAEVKDVAKVGDFMTPNLEAIAAATPDLVLVTGGVQADTLGKLEELGVPVVVVDPQDLEGVYTAIANVSEMVGEPNKGMEVVGKMKADLAEIERTLADAEPVKSFIEIGWNPLYTVGQGTLLNDLLVKAGGVNVVEQPGYVSYSVEQLVKDQPEVYLGTLTSIGDAKSLAKRSGYSALAAVKDGKVFALDDNLVSRPGPRVIEGVREIAKALHPDLFQ